MEQAKAIFYPDIEYGNTIPVFDYNEKTKAFEHMSEDGAVMSYDVTFVIEDPQWLHFKTQGKEIVKISRMEIAKIIEYKPGY